MASPEELAPQLPDTLPDDFGEWDGGTAPPQSSGNSDGWDAAQSNSEPPKPLWQSDDRDAILDSLAERPRVPGSTGSTPVFVAKQKSQSNREKAAPAAAPVNSREWEAWEASHAFGKNSKPAQSAERKPFSPPPVDKTRDSRTAPSAPVSSKQQKDNSDTRSEASSGVKPVNPNEWKAWEASQAFGKNGKTPAQSTDRNSYSSPAPNGSRDSRQASAAPASPRQQKDLGDSKSEASSAAKPASSTEWKTWEAAHTFGKNGKPNGHSSERDAVKSPVVVSRRDTPSASSTSASSKSQMSTSALVEESPSDQIRGVEVGQTSSKAAAAVSADSSALTPASAREADQALFQLFSSKNTETTNEETAPKKKKWIKIAALTSVWVLLPVIVLIPFLHHGTKAATKSSAQPAPAATESQLQTNPPAPTDTFSSTPEKPAAGASKQQPTDSQPAPADDGSNRPPVQSKMMNDQLSAPTRIPEGIKNQVAEDGPPPSMSLGADGLGGGQANAGLFNRRPEPVVKAAPTGPLNISSGVAAGMLIQKTPPVYPNIARSARVAGTVELHAVIAKNGTIKDLQVVSGPAMLRQAAADAVRTWRYRPYKLNNEPTEVETTINVIFSLGG